MGDCLDPEVWAREHAHVIFKPMGHTGASYVAQIERDGLVFEGRASGQTRQARKLEGRAIDEAVGAYLDFVQRMSEQPQKAQKTQLRGIDPRDREALRGGRDPGPRAEDVEDALDRVIRAESDEDGD